MLHGSHQKQLFKGVQIQTYWHNKLKEMSQKIMDTKTITTFRTPRQLLPASWLMIDQVGISFIFSTCKLFRNFLCKVTFVAFTILYQQGCTSQIGLIFCHVTRWTVVTCAWTCNPRCTFHKMCFSLWINLKYKKNRVIFCIFPSLNLE